MGNLMSQTLNSNTSGSEGNTFVMVYDLSALSLPSWSITQVRVTISSSSIIAYTIDNMYIGHQAASGDVYDFLATPAQILWAGAAGKAMGTFQTATSDWATFAYNKTSKLSVAFYASSAANNGMRYDNVTGANAYYKAANEAGTVNKTASYNTNNLNYIISKIEYIDVAPPPSGVFSFF